VCVCKELKRVDAVDETYVLQHFLPRQSSQVSCLPVEEVKLKECPPLYSTVLLQVQDEVPFSIFEDIVHVYV